MVEGYKYTTYFDLTRTSEYVAKENKIELINSIAEKYQIKFNNVCFSGKRKTKIKLKFLRLTDKNIEKLKAIDSRDIGTLEFAQYTPKIGEYFRDTVGKMFFLTDDYYTTEYVPPDTFLVILDSLVIKHSFNINDILPIFKGLKDLEFIIENGISFTKETRSEPEIFCFGTGTKYMSREDRAITSALCMHRTEYQTKIWDVFWFNIIKKELITNDVLNKIKNALSEENVHDIGSHYITSLPVTAEEYVYDHEKTSGYKNKLRQIFLEHDLIMYDPNKEYIDVFDAIEESMNSKHHENDF